MGEPGRPGAGGTSCPTFSGKSTRKSGENSSKNCGIATATSSSRLHPGRAGGRRPGAATSGGRARRPPKPAPPTTSPPTRRAGQDRRRPRPPSPTAPEGTAGYRVLARLRERRTSPSAIPRRRSPPMMPIASAIPPTRQPLQDLATVRAGLMLVDTAPLAELTQRLEPATGAGAPFRHTARELLALSALRAGDAAADQPLDRCRRPTIRRRRRVRTRAEMLMTLATEAGKS